MHPHEQLITRFYTAFQKRDAAGMASCYHPEVTFSDQAFQLKGKRAMAMWHMLCEAGKDLQLTFTNVQADNHTGSAHWEPIYTFSVTGRKVHNIIDAEFKFKDGKIIEHRDSFDFWRWSRMALGMPGILLGWTPLIRNAVQKKAIGNLEKFIEKHQEYK